MSLIVYGDPEDVIHNCKKMGQLVYANQEVLVSKYIMEWKSYSLDRITRVFVSPTQRLNPKDLFPRQDRIVAFPYGGVPSVWRKWGENNSVEFVEFKSTPVQLINILGTKYTKQAAVHLVACNPGGLYPVVQAAKYIEYLQLKKPYSYEDIVSVWPYAIQEGKTYKVSLTKLNKLLGTKEGVVVCNTLSDGEAYSAMAGLYAVNKNKQQDVAELIGIILKGVKDKRWKPKLGLLLISFLLMSEKSYLEKIQSLYQLLEID